MERETEYVRRIVNAVGCIDGLFDVGAKWRGVKANTLTLLYALDDGQPHTQKSISEGWFIPRTTLNTIIKECEAAGYVRLKPIPGRKRDLHICLTEAGQAYAEEVLAPVHQAERKAIRKTLREGVCGPGFIEDLERFCENLKTAFQEVEVT